MENHILPPGDYCVECNVISLMCIFSIFPKIQLYLFISFCTWIFSSATHWCFFLQYWFEFLQILEELINENENVDSQSRIGFQLSAHHKIWNSGKENKSPSKSAFQDQGILVTGTHHWTCEHASSNDPDSESLIQN